MMMCSRIQMSSSSPQAPIRQEDGLNWLSSPSEDPAWPVRDGWHLWHHTHQTQNRVYLNQSDLLGYFGQLIVSLPLCFGHRSNTWSVKRPQDGSEGDERHGLVQTSERTVSTETERSLAVVAALEWAKILICVFAFRLKDHQHGD